MTWLEADPAIEARYRRVQELDVASTGVSPLLEALFDDSWRVRRLAADRLSALESKDALVTSLLEVLARRGQTGARNAAATALAHLGPTVVPPLLGLLQHPDPDQRKFAADILGELQRAEATDGLIAALADGDPNVRLSAAEALGKTGGQRAQRALEQLLREPDPLLQVGALEALTALDAPPPLPMLVPLLASPLTRRSAFRLLGRVRHRAAAVLVVRGLRERTTRDAALLALGGATASLGPEVEAELAASLAGVPDAAAWLTRCLGSEDQERRVGALHLVRAVRMPELAPQVAEAASGGDASPLALAVLLSLGTPGLVALLESDPPAILSLSREGRAVASEAVVELASPRFVGPLTALLESGEPELGEVAVRALGRCASLAAREPLLRALDDDALAAVASRALVQLAQVHPAAVREALAARVEGRLQPHLVRCWANVAGPGALQAIRRALHDESEGVRAAAAQMAGVSALEAPGLLGLAVVDESVRVRRGAARGVAGLSPSAGRPLLERLLADREPTVLSLATTAALESGAAWALPRLLELTSHPDAAVVLGATQALLGLGGADDDTLSRLARHPDGEVVKLVLGEAAWAAVVIDEARRALTDPRWDVRIAAARALGVGGDGTHLTDLTRARATESEPLADEALARAIEALGRR